MMVLNMCPLLSLRTIADFRLAETLDTVLAILGISSPDDLRQRREMSAASIGATLSNNASSSGGSSGIAHVPVSKEMEQEEKKK
jgi:hypothetical protein